MASVIAKWQKCGKPSCRCSEGILHGPYFWLVEYVSKKSNYNRKGKYSWRYLGKNPEDAWEKLGKFNRRFNEKYNLLDLNDKIQKLKHIKEKSVSLKSMEQILTVEDAITDK
ncbi:MAG: DUF6788 family protein [Candidatus Hodarchaeales archaeon]|jgi:hypothetical protein